MRDVCDCRQQTCWDDGRRRQERQATRSAATFRGGPSNGAWGNNRLGASSAQGSAPVSFRRGKPWPFRRAPASFNRRENVQWDRLQRWRAQYDGEQLSSTGMDGLVDAGRQQCPQARRIATATGRAFRWMICNCPNARIPKLGKTRGRRGAAIDFNQPATSSRNVFQQPVFRDG